MKIVAVTPVKNPNPKALPRLIFSVECVTFLSKKIEKTAAPGTNKQQLKFFIPGTVERTAAANPHTSVGRYFLIVITFN